MQEFINNNHHFLGLNLGYKGDLGSPPSDKPKTSLNMDGDSNQQDESSGKKVNKGKGRDVQKLSKRNRSRNLTRGVLDNIDNPNIKRVDYVENSNKDSMNKDVNRKPTSYKIVKRRPNAAMIAYMQNSKNKTTWFEVYKQRNGKVWKVSNHPVNIEKYMRMNKQFKYYPFGVKYSKYNTVHIRASRGVDIGLINNGLSRDSQFVKSTVSTTSNQPKKVIDLTTVDKDNEQTIKATEQVQQKRGKKRVRFEESVHYNDGTSNATKSARSSTSTKSGESPTSTKSAQLIKSTKDTQLISSAKDTQLVVQSDFSSQEQKIQDSMKFLVSNPIQKSNKTLEHLFTLPVPSGTIQPNMLTKLPEPRKVGNFRMIESWEVISREDILNMPRELRSEYSFCFDYYIPRSFWGSGEIAIVQKDFNHLIYSDSELLKQLLSAKKIYNPRKPYQGFMPPADLGRLVNKVLNDTWFNYPNLVIIGPQDFYNIARVQPLTLFPGHYKDLFQNGTLRPLPPTLSMDVKKMSTDQLNYAMSYFVLIDILDKEKCLQGNPHLIKVYDNFLRFYNIAAEEIRLRNVIYHYYIREDTRIYYAQYVRYYWSLDNAWDKLQEDFGRLLFENYKPFHHKDKLQQWKYLSVPEKYYEPFTYKQKVATQVIPVCQPSWRRGHPAPGL